MVIQEAIHSGNKACSKKAISGVIAEASGLGDLRTLGTYFRRQIGMSPRKWRKIYYRSTYTPRSSL